MALSDALEAEVRNLQQLKAHAEEQLGLLLAPDIGDFVRSTDLSDVQTTPRDLAAIISRWESFKKNVLGR